jgi:hypothetical protein
MVWHRRVCGYWCGVLGSDRVYDGLLVFEAVWLWPSAGWGCAPYYIKQCRSHLLCKMWLFASSQLDVICSGLNPNSANLVTGSRIGCSLPVAASSIDAVAAGAIEARLCHKLVALPCWMQSVTW